MRIEEDFNAKDKIWFHGCYNNLKLKKPSCDKVFFVTSEFSYASRYSGISKNDNFIYFLTLSDKIRVFDFEEDSYSYCKQLGWPIEFSEGIQEVDLYNFIKYFSGNQEIENEWQGWIKIRDLYPNIKYWIEDCLHTIPKLRKYINKWKNMEVFEYEEVWDIIGEIILKPLSKIGFNAFKNDEMKSKGRKGYESIGIFNIDAIDEITIRGLLKKDIQRLLYSKNYEEQQKVAWSLINGTSV